MLTLVLWLLIAVLVSAVIDQIVPRISLPLIQVVMGAVIAIFAGKVIDVDLDPDLFLVLFIAPLLYLEAKSADKALLWRNRKPILSLAIGLVIVTTLIIGFSVNALIPAIPLAAAFALGAALGPTDAVAVTSLSKTVALPERQLGILKGELLLNDASGIVSFQFALAAVTIGVFNIVDAGIAFVVEFVGGLALGLVLGYLFNFALRCIRSLGIESNTFHVLYEICIPFVVYLMSNMLHVSGIIAVVTAGLVNVIAPRTVSPAIAHMNIVSTNVWHVISFALNGIVFVMLGTQIPTAMFYTWNSPAIDDVSLVLFVLFITFVLMGVRFLWCLGMEIVHVKMGEKRRLTRKDWQNTLLVTLCGSKGTITLSILFTIPFFIQTGPAFPSRSLIIFLGCGVILCTLLIANFIVPLVAPKREHKQTEIEARQNYYETLIDILRNVIEDLTAQQVPTNRRSTRNVIKIYQNRLNQTKEHISDGKDSDDDETDVALRIQAYEWEQECAEMLLSDGAIERDIGLSYIDRLDRYENYLRHRDSRSVPKRLSAGVRIVLSAIRGYLVRLLGRTGALPQKREKMKQLQIQTAEYVTDILRTQVFDDQVQTEYASQLLLSYQQRLSSLRGSGTSVTTSFKIADETDDILRMAYQIELEQIQKMYEEDRISRHEANRMRDNVQVMIMDLDDKL